jgi:tellurite resistance protein TerC
MIPLTEITWLHWTAFLGAILFFLALDLGVFHRKAHAVRFREALAWTTVWFTMAMLFGFLVVPNDPGKGWISGPRSEFITGYILELSLSMDNVFVIALIFGYFQVRIEYQHRVLFWGILGALIMRGIMIGLGAALVHQFGWILYVFGAFLLLTGVKMLFSDDQGVHPERNPVVRLARRFFPISKDFDGQHFITRADGRLMLTPLALVLIVVETTDLVFAVDSIPAIFGVTQSSFIVFTSNVFAILGLRSLYFVLAGMIGYFRFLKIGLSVVLIYIGVKMLSAMWGWKISTNVSLGIVVGIIALSIIVSLVAARWTRQEQSADRLKRD